MATLTLVNDFHRTQINVRVKNKGLKGSFGEPYYEISKRVYNKIKRTLCGMDDCWCRKISNSYALDESCTGETRYFIVDNN